jgi:rhodanese-related sulfurtransferase
MEMVGMSEIRRVLIALGCSILATLVVAEPAVLAEKKRTTQGLYLSAEQAHAMKQAQGQSVALIDVRTRAELGTVGMASGVDANVPLYRADLEQWDTQRGSYSMVPNEAFEPSLDAVIKGMGLDKNSPIILMCRSGGRSAAAADKLAARGYTRVYSVTDGFEGDKAKAGPEEGRRVVNGWKNAGAPWTTSIDASLLH